VLGAKQLAPHLTKDNWQAQPIQSVPKDKVLPNYRAGLGGGRTASLSLRLQHA
jgi:hypothetical protein